MKKILTILMSVLLTLSVSMVNIFADTFTISSNGKLSTSGWNQSTHDSISIGEGVSLTVDCFAVLNSLEIKAGATVTIIPSDGNPNGFMINNGGTITLGNGASLVAIHEDEKSDGLLDIKGSTVTGLELWRPADPNDEKITNPVNGVFNYNTEVNRWYINDGPDFGPTDENPYVIHFHCGQGGSVEISGLTIEDDNKLVDGEYTYVRLPNTVQNVVFTYTESEGNVLDGIWIEQDGDNDDTRFVDLENDTRHDAVNKTFTLNLNDYAVDDGGYKFVDMDFNFRSESGDFGPTDEFPYVINYHGNEGGSVEISGIAIEDENKLINGDNVTVRLPNSVSNVVFTYIPYEGNRLDGIWVEQDGDNDASRFVDLENDTRHNATSNTFTLDISSNQYCDPSNPDYKFVNLDFSFINEVYELCFPNDAPINGNVITYRVQKDDDYRDVKITVTGTTVDSENHKVLIPTNDLGSVTFSIDYNDFGQKYIDYWERFERNFDLRISNSEVSIPLDLTNRQTSLATVPSDIDLPNVLNLEVAYYKFPWYTISYGNSGNVQTEHGSVLVERIHCGENTFTNIESEIDESNKIYAMSKLTGGNSDTEADDYDPDKDTLAKYKLSYGTGDIFVELGTGGVSIDYKFVPEYGYQVTDIVLNENNSILGEFDPNNDVISEFKFTTVKNSNVHFLVLFTKTNDITDLGNASNINSASITNGANAAKTGNLALTVGDTATDTTIENAVSTFDVTLDNVVSMGRQDKNWTTNITEFDNPIIVNLKLDTSEYDGENYTVVREHDGVKEVLSGTTYNETTGELTFPTNKFSKYTIVEIPKPNHDSGSSSYVAPKTGIR